MSNETQRVYLSTAVTLEANGSAIANSAVGTADDATLDLSSYNDYPHAKFMLSAACASAFTTMGPVHLLAQPLNISGTNDGPAPTATYPHRRVGTFSMYAGTSTQYQDLDAYDLPRVSQYYLSNGAGQQISAGWTLTAIPFTFKPVP